VEEPECVSFWVELLLKSLHTTSSFILVVDHQSLEVKEVPWGRWKSIEWVDFLLWCCGFFGWLLFLWSWLLLFLLLWLSSSILEYGLKTL
jgi:hypothetical protein